MITKNSTVWGGAWWPAICLVRIPGWLVSVPCWGVGDYSKAMWHQGGELKSLRYQIGMVSTCRCSQQVTSLITFWKFWKLHLEKRKNRKLWCNPLWNATSLPSWDSKSTETQIVVVTSLLYTLLQNLDESGRLKHPKWPKMVGVWDDNALRSIIKLSHKLRWWIQGLSVSCMSQRRNATRPVL